MSKHESYRVSEAQGDAMLGPGTLPPLPRIRVYTRSMIVLPLGEDCCGFEEGTEEW